MPAKPAPVPYTGVKKRIAVAKFLAPRPPTGTSSIEARVQSKTLLQSNNIPCGPIHIPD